MAVECFAISPDVPLWAEFPYMTNSNNAVHWGDYLIFVYLGAQLLHVAYGLGDLGLETPGITHLRILLIDVLHFI